MSLRTRGTARRVSCFLVLALMTIPCRTFAQDPAAPTSSTRALVPMYVSFATLQALDIHSTLRALDHGATEANPTLSGVAQQPAALVGVKAVSAASTIWLAHKMSKRSRTGALVLMAAVNSAYAMVVAHNYRAVR